MNLANILADRVLADPNLTAKVQSDPTVLKSVAHQVTRDNPAYYNDKWVYRAVIFILGVVMISVVLGLLRNGDDTSDAVVAMGSAALGALAGLLAPSPARST